MSNDEYQHKAYWSKDGLCIEKDKDGKCLVSARYVYLDFNEDVKLFCKELKKNKNDKTV
jgi:hypothetical protein